MKPAGPRPASPLPAPSDWTFGLIDEYHDVIRATAERYGLDTYPNQLEIITAEQMMDAYASVGMPVNYRHWSYGKEFIATESAWVVTRRPGTLHSPGTDREVFLEER
ncbi:SpoVR family protein, partial [Roseateles sp.]|uniref:SpoVR family protein n=1 Tax=Roseateles sp. TaxID=1971397 RepID=UPI00286AF3E8